MTTAFLVLPVGLVRFFAYILFPSARILVD